MSRLLQRVAIVVIAALVVVVGGAFLFGTTDRALETVYVHWLLRCGHWRTSGASTNKLSNFELLRRLIQIVFFLTPRADNNSTF